VRVGCLLSDDVEEHWESHVAEYFPQCPLCGSKALEFDVEYGSVKDYIYCLDCKAKWEIDWKGDDFKIEYVILLENGDTEKYGNLMKEKHSPEFWLEIINTKEEKPTAKTEAISKVRCKYCATLFNEVLDVCPYCGGER
jgi:RNA polymerase subunit RPABC4/transcription elongation factor Spt4